MVFHLSWCTDRSSLKRYLSLTLDRSHLQRLRISVLFPMLLSMPASLERDPSCLASLSSNFQLWVVLSQHQSSRVTRGSPYWWLKYFHISCSSPGDRDWVIISVPASSSCSEGPTSSSSFTMQTDLVLHFFFCIGMTATGICCSSGSAAV